MRLIGDFDSKQEAELFSSFLKSKNVNNRVEEPTNLSEREKTFAVWVFDEDDLHQAFILYQEYTSNPKAHLVQSSDPLLVEADRVILPGRNGFVKISIGRVIRPFSYFITYVFLIVCTAIFVLNLFEKKRIAAEEGLLVEELLLTPSQILLLFDYTQAMEALQQAVKQLPFTADLDVKHLPAANQEAIHQAEMIPSWKGILYIDEEKPQGSIKPDAPIVMFEKIREGQIWRLFTPSLLHSDFLHLLFNMSWLWILGRQIEARLSRFKMLLLITVIAVVASIAQYLMSGPYFLGFSGVVVGMAGFIWARQKKAPWEGYPLQKTTLYFILGYIILMVGLEIALILFKYLSSYQFGLNIANTAHVVGGLVGLGLGRMNYFSRGNV